MYFSHVFTTVKAKCKMVNTSPNGRQQRISVCRSPRIINDNYENTHAYDHKKHAHKVKYTMWYVVLFLHTRT